MLSERAERKINKNPQGFIQVLQGAPKGITAGNPPKHLSAKYISKYTSP
jgi:hypothetical protein